MRPRPGQNAMRISGGLVLLAFLGLLVPVLWWSFSIGVAALLLLGIYDYLIARGELSDIEVFRKVPDVVGRDRGFPLELHLTRTTGTSANVEVFMEAPAIAKPAELNRMPAWEHEELHVTERFAIPERGKHVFGHVWVRLSGPLGIVESQREFEVKHDVKVLPEVYFTDEALRKDANSQLEMLDKIVRERQHGVGTEFESLREFRDGDDPRRIDWRTTARVRRPVVRRYQIERHRDVMIVVDSGRLMAAKHDDRTKLDAAIDAGLVLTRVALEGGDRCGFGLFDHEVVGYVPPRSGKPAVKAIQDQVYDAQSRYGESDFSQMFAMLQRRQSKRTLMVIISDILDLQTTDRYRASLARLCQRHLVLFAALKTPLLHDVLNRVPDNFREAWQVALSYRLLKERELALHSLQKSGITVLDVVPEQIGPRLVNQFLDLRSRNIL